MEAPAVWSGELDQIRIASDTETENANPVRDERSGTCLASCPPDNRFRLQKHYTKCFDVVRILATGIRVGRFLNIFEDWTWIE